MTFQNAVEKKQSVPSERDIMGDIYTAVVVPSASKDFRAYLEYYQMELQNDIEDEMAIPFSKNSEFKVVYLLYFDGECFFEDVK